LLFVSDSTDVIGRAVTNNLSERTLRAVALGRNNWGVLGSEAGGRTAAVLYSAVLTCKHLGIDPFVYLRGALPALFALGRSPPPRTCWAGCRTGGGCAAAGTPRAVRPALVEPPRATQQSNAEAASACESQRSAGRRRLHLLREAGNVIRRALTFSTRSGRRIS